MTEVVITQNDRIETAIVEALERVPLASIVRRRVVAVKPNETWASREDTTGITQPDTLRAVLRAIRAYEPRTLVVTGGAGAAETDEVFRTGGLSGWYRSGASRIDQGRIRDFVRQPGNRTSDPRAEPSRLRWAWHRACSRLR